MKKGDKVIRQKKRRLRAIKERARRKEKEAIRHRQRMRKYLFNHESYLPLDYDKHTIYMLDGVRTNSAKDREPQTIRWIEAFMKPGEVLYDIGANVGAFSMVAAVNDVKVYAFEPSMLTFVALVKNIGRNNLDKMVIPLNVPLSSSESIAPFHYRDVGFGESGHSFNGDINIRGDIQIPVMSQMMMSTTIDHIVYKYKMPVPNHIKIDVDGLEASVLSGASRVLKNKRVKSVLVETMGASHIPIGKMMSRHGFDLCNELQSDINRVYRKT